MQQFPPSPRPGVAKFSARQVEVMIHWVHIPSASEAARALNIAEDTYRTHLKRMRGKLGVSRTFDVYRYMVAEGVLGCGG